MESTFISLASSKNPWEHCHNVASGIPAFWFFLEIRSCIPWSAFVCLPLWLCDHLLFLKDYLAILLSSLLNKMKLPGFWTYRFRNYLVRRNVSLFSLCLELFIFEVASLPKGMAYGDINLFFSLYVSGEQLFPVGSAAGQGGRGDVTCWPEWSERNQKPEELGLRKAINECSPHASGLVWPQACPGKCISGWVRTGAWWALRARKDLLSKRIFCCIFCVLNSTICLDQNITF